MSYNFGYFFEDRTIILENTQYDQMIMIDTRNPLHYPLEVGDKNYDVVPPQDVVRYRLVTRIIQ